MLRTAVLVSAALITGFLALQTPSQAAVGRQRRGAGQNDCANRICERESDTTGHCDPRAGQDCIQVWRSALTGWDSVTGNPIWTLPQRSCMSIGRCP